MTNLNLSTVKSAYKRLGLFADNPKHAVMFETVLYQTVKPILIRKA